KTFGADEELIRRHLIELGLNPGPRFTPIIDAAFEAQLDGAFMDESGGRIWLGQFLTSQQSGETGA
ncbi:MAG: hypothetical protein WCQ89_18985, partial [Verrucomicrobiota bacterium]